MGMATILHARRIVLLATGAAKARCVERMIDGPMTPRLPASFLQLHRDGGDLAGSSGGGERLDDARDGRLRVRRFEQLP